jgi:uncharacterized protein (TIGR00369 family)
MDDCDPNLKALLKTMLGAMPFVSALGVEIVSATNGSVILEVPLSPVLEAPTGSFAASSVGVLGDMAAMLAVTSAMPIGNAMSTLDFTIKMLGKSVGTHLRAIGQAKQIGKTTCVGASEILVKQNNNWIACGTLLATGRRISFA